jgi:hypothetical protein
VQHSGILGAVTHRETAALEAGLDGICESPKDDGRVELVVRRPAVEEREVLDEAVPDPEGLLGDSWRSHSEEPDGAAPDMRHGDERAAAVASARSAMAARG